MERKELYKSLTCALAGLCAVLIIGVCVKCVEQQAASRTIRAGYENSLYNTLDGLDSVYGELCKAEFSTDRDYKRELYREISAQASVAISRLSELPISQGSMQKTEELLNHISDYCGFLSRQDKQQDNETENVAGLRKCCGRLNDALRDLGGMLHVGDDVFASDILEQTDLAWQQAEADSVTYPTLIYDGPFSQSEEIGKARQQRQEVNAEQAADLIDFIFNGAPHTGDNEGKIPAYIFEKDNKSAAVTKQGGLLLWYMDASEQSGGGINDQQAQSTAEDFLDKLGYNDFEIVFISKTEDSVIFNATPVQDGAALYPDLVKVRVSLSSGNVIGFEGSSYVVNNRPRQELKADITVDAARERISWRLTVQKTRLCVVPLNNSDVLAWEFYGIYGSEKYIVYIDAASGKQIQIFRIIQTDNGEMVV